MQCGDLENILLTNFRLPMTVIPKNHKINLDIDKYYIIYFDNVVGLGHVLLLVVKDRKAFFFDPVGEPPSAYNLEHLPCDGYNGTQFQDSRGKLCAVYVMIYAVLNHAGVSDVDVVEKYFSRSVAANDVAVRHLAEHFDISIPSRSQQVLAGKSEGVFYKIRAVLEANWTDSKSVGRPLKYAGQERPMSVVERKRESRANIAARGLEMVEQEGWLAWWRKLWGRMWWRKVE